MKNIYLGLGLFVIVLLLFGCIEEVFSLNANFNSNNIKNGETAQLHISVTLLKNHEYAPIVRIRTENASDAKYLSFSTTEWQLERMNHQGDTQNNEINITAQAPANSATFNIVVELLANGSVTNTKKVALTVNR